MKKKFVWVLLSFLLVAALVLTSCAPAVPGEQEEEEEEEEVGPQYGGTLTVATLQCTGDITSWDVNRGTGSTIYAASPYLENLIAADVSKGLTGTGEHTFGNRFVPLEFTRGKLAESWELLTDPLRFVFHLRQGIMWSESPIMEAREFTADDVVFTLERVLACPKRGVEAAPHVWGFVDTITATDRYTVTVGLNWVYPDWPYRMGWGDYSNITPHELVEAGADDWNNHVGIGTGPFTLERYVDASLIEYVKNPDYWDTTTIDGVEYQVPFVDKLVWPIIKEEATQLALLRTGKLDIWERGSWVYKDSLANSNPELKVWDVDSWEGLIIYLQGLDRPPLDDIRVRQAMSMAIDRQELIDMVYGGYGVMHNVPFPTAYPESIRTPWEQQPEAVRDMYEYNPDEARDLLADAGYADGFKLEVGCMADPLHIDAVSLVKDYWFENLNIELDIVPVDPGSWWGIYLGDPPPYRSLAYFDCSPTPLFALTEWASDLHKRCIAFDDPAFYDAYDSWLVESDEDTQNALLKEANDRLIAGVAGIFLPGYQYPRYAWPWVKNYEGEVVSGYCNSLTLNSIIWIDQAMKAEMGY